MWMFVGLGNPGADYARNRHNIGFMAVEAFGVRWSFPEWRSKFHGLVSEGTVGGQKILLLKPQTFMNLSGESVAAAARFYKIHADRIVVFHDELDLPPGKLRVKRGGGNAGHNGLKSIDAHLGTPDYVRVRLGIGHPGDRDRVHDYVLGDFSKADAAWVAPLLEVVAEHAPLLMGGQTTDFTSRVAAAVPDAQ
ncbi:MAG TPA: aminoacyl-tRNA hydrolase [Alphaproteobacteria bacterium]|nr:aminoacyl-tRNA hydrolase [Alphaproteobacteria bacterium]